MSPQEIKDYVDAVAASHTSRTILYFIAAPILVFIASYLGSYLNEKGKNAASKEDIAELTRRVEGVKQGFNQSIEEFRTGLLAQLEYSKYRYQEETKVIKEVWRSLCELRFAFQDMRPVFDSHPGSNEAEKERDQKRLERCNDAYKEFSICSSVNSPFFAQSIGTKLDELRKLIWVEMVDFAFKEEVGSQRWKKILDNQKQVFSKMDEVECVIRARLEKVESTYE
jgi:hypothetical protein